VTNIDVTFDGREFSVFNNGPGIPVQIHAELTEKKGYDVYIPEMAFSEFMAGTNTEKALDNVKGGINGLGAKIANALSEEFTVETLDASARIRYKKVWRNGMMNSTPCELTRIPKSAKAADVKPFTRVSFIPSYLNLGYDRSNPAHAEAFRELDCWLRMRVHQSAAYIGPKVVMTYNGVVCNTTSAAQLSSLILPFYCGGGDVSRASIIETTIASKEVIFCDNPIQMAVIILPAEMKSKSFIKNMSIINGVVSNKGSHIDYFKKAMKAAIGEKINKLISKTGAAKTAPANVFDGVYLVICGAIPGADWGGQNKDEIQMRPEIFQKYNIPAAFLNKVKECVASKFCTNQSKTKATKFVHDKYFVAKNAGKVGKKQDTKLLAAEGDSALTLLRAGLTQVKASATPGPSFDWCGMISLQGVIINAAREVKSLKTTEGDTINVRSMKLQENHRLLALADAFGLKYDRTYETKEELDTLNYGQLLLCVDQDLDGTGKIAALVLVWIYLFWPALIKAGKIGRLMTPLIRARLNSKRRGAAAAAGGAAAGVGIHPSLVTAGAHAQSSLVAGAHARPSLVEFYYEKELDHWLEEDPTRALDYSIKYYKGLATHDEDEVKIMFKPDTFRQNIYTYTMDDTAKHLFEVYFGSDPSLRKNALITPVEHLPIERMLELKAERSIPVGRVQLDIDTKSYKIDAINRQISGAVDGLNPTRRKILLGAMMRFAETGTKDLKIYQLGGFVADKCFYHHGDTSLSATITYMAQSFSGARKYPFLIGVGQFGSRHGDAAGSARYISVKKSPMMAATFPPQDRWHLTYTMEDGMRAEPQYFVPVVPIAAIESYCIVSEGWKHDSFGRDLNSVIKIVNAYIDGHPRLHKIAGMFERREPLFEILQSIAALAGESHPLAQEFPLPVCTRGSTSKIRNYKGYQYSFGTYELVDDKIISITELPIGLTTAKYMETLSKPSKNGKENPRAQYIESIHDNSTSDLVRIDVTLRPGVIPEIEANFGSSEIDPIEDLFMLRASLRPHLNYYSVDGAVLEFGDCYHATILYWAPIRHKLYIERVTRQQTILELKIQEEQEIIRFITLSSDLKLSSLADDTAAEAKLQQNGFQRIDSGLLHQPEYTANAELVQLVKRGRNASYNYLLNLRERDLLEDSKRRRIDRIVKLEEELQNTKLLLAESPLPCASLWRAEIANFLATVEKGIASNWSFK
jgi:DNA gyrase/topoisomerase IV subunit B